jgi:hypothetical protein
MKGYDIIRVWRSSARGHFARTYFTVCPLNRFHFEKCFSVIRTDVNNRSNKFPAFIIFHNDVK